MLVLGLDCASPQLVFDEFRQDLPNLNSLMQQGTYGELESSLPCITIPAWSSMFSGRDAGILGQYGFRNRLSYDYDSLQLTDATQISIKRIWDWLGDYGKQSLVMNVPQTYPVVPIQGHLISGLLTPSRHQTFAYPAIYKAEVLKIAPDYAFDVSNFRTQDKSQLLQQLYDLTDIQYRVLEWSLKHKQWDFAVHVNIAMDRLQHAFWRYHDTSHHKYEPHSPYRYAIRDYYQFVDEWIGRLLVVIDDHTSVVIVSDHGVKHMNGAICINEWLCQQDWLVLRKEPTSEEITPFHPQMVDWSQTRAWSTGGYYGRIFFNVAGRESKGIIQKNDIENIRNELIAQFQTLTDDKGCPLKVEPFIPDEIYQQVNGIAPDLMLYFGDLHWRSVGSLGYSQHWTFSNDTGTDDANHAQEGLFVVYHPKHQAKGRIAKCNILDIAPTILHHMKLPIPRSMQGQVI